MRMGLGLGGTVRCLVLQCAGGSFLRILHSDEHITWKWKMASWKTTFFYKQWVFHFHDSELECGCWFLWRQIEHDRAKGFSKSLGRYLRKNHATSLHIQSFAIETQAEANTCWLLQPKPPGSIILGPHPECLATTCG